MKTLIFICLIAFAHALKLPQNLQEIDGKIKEILQKFDGNTNFGFRIELKDGSIIKDACFFTAKTIPNKYYQYNYEDIFIPREGMTCAIKKESIKKIIISSIYAGKFLVLKNFDIINSDLIKENNSYKIYNSKIFGKIKVKNRNINNKAPITLNNDNKEIVRIESSISITPNIKNIKGLADFKIIETLNLSNSQVEDISALKGMQKLRLLDISNSQVSDLKNLTDLPNLKSLNLSNTKVSDIKALKGMQNLYDLDISNSQVEDISVLKDLPELHNLNLSNTKVKDISALKGMPRLSDLNLSNSKVEDIRVLKGIPNLRRLNLSNSKVKDIKALKGMQNLKKLVLSNSKVVDIKALKGMPYLQSLNLSNSKVKDISALKGIPNLAWLNLSNSKINNFNVLQDLSNLASLDVSNHKSFDCKILTKLKKLLYLNIINTKIVNFDNIPSSVKILSLNQKGINLTNLPKLNSIHFDFKNKNHLEQVIKSKIQKISFKSFKGDFSFLKDLHACKELNFNNTNFSDLSLLANQVNSLEYLNIEDCPIKDFSFLKNFNNLSVKLNVDKDTLLKLKMKYPNIKFYGIDFIYEIYDIEYFLRIYYS